MSETMSNPEATSRKAYEVKVDPIAFEPDADMKYLTSIDFCKLTNEYFRAAFADYIGSTFDVNQGIPSISLYFTHADVEGTRCVNRADKKESGSSLLDKTRSRDLLYREGDRFLITDDGIDIIKPLLMPRAFNGGKPKWKELVSDQLDRSSMNFYNPQMQQQVTKITAIDPRQICAIIYGKKSDDNSYMDYAVQVCGDLGFKNGLMPGSNSNFVLEVRRAYNAHIEKTYEKFGIMNAGSSIIR